MPDTNLTISTNSLSQTLDVHQITPEYFILHYAEFIRRVVAKGNPSDDTMRHYCNQIDFFIRWCLSHERNPLAMNEYQLIMYREFLLNRQYKPDSIQVMLVAVKAFYAAAKKVGLIGINPAAELEAPSIGSNSEALLHYYTPQQMNEIVHVFDEDTNPFTRYRNTLILYLMGVEGLRRVEVMRLNDEDIDYERKRILIRGKGHNGFIYPCDATMDRLMDYLHLRGPVEPDNGVTPTIISFSNRRYGKRITRTGLHVIISKALEFAGVKYPGHACHTLRHSCGTNLYHETKDLRVVQETLRHSSPEMTARYSHVDERSSTRPTRNIIPISKGDVGVRDGGV